MVGLFSCNSEKYSACLTIRRLPFQFELEVFEFLGVHQVACSRFRQYQLICSDNPTVRSFLGTIARPAVQFSAIEDHFPPLSTLCICQCVVLDLEIIDASQCVDQRF